MPNITEVERYISDHVTEHNNHATEDVLNSTEVERYNNDHVTEHDNHAIQVSCQTLPK
jgi:hypothetical protein